jgi:nicotinamidase-related amidase
MSDQSQKAWPFPAISFPLEPRRTALLLIDMQYIDAHPEYGIGRIWEKMAPGSGAYFYSRLDSIVVPALQRALTFFREHGLRVIHITHGSETPDGSDLSARARLRNAERERLTGLRSWCRKGDFEHQIIPQLQPINGELVVNKVSTGAFRATGLEQILRNMDIVGLAIGGVYTNCCIETTARSAADRGFSTILLDDGCAAFDQASHNATLKSFRMVFGEVLGVDKFLVKLESAF